MKKFRLRLSSVVWVCTYKCAWGAGFTHRTLEEVCVCISNYTEEETGRRLAFSLTLNSECSNRTVLKSEKNRKSGGPQRVSHRVYFWSLFKINRNHFKKEEFCSSLGQKNMSGTGVNPHLEGIISDFEGLSSICSHFLCSVIAHLCSLWHLSNTNCDQTV